MRLILLLPFLLAPLAAATVVRDDPATCYAESLRLETAGDYAGARTALAPLQVRQGSDYLLNLRLGWLALCAGDQAGAIKAYGIAQRASADSLEPRLGILRVFIAGGRYDEAERQARMILQLDGGNYTASLLLVSALRGQGRSDPADREIDRLLTRYPSDADALALKAALACDRGRLEDAQAIWKRILLTSPTNAAALAGLGTTAAR